MRSMLRHALLALTCLLTATLSAQASRTWISGVGDDVNPGSRTAPCKTFAGAISKTAAGGEVDCLDPGGFGGVTITKSITLDGGGGQVASVLVSGTNGITVSAGGNDVVTLRNLRIMGLNGAGLSGIRFNSGKALIIENCFIDGFGTNGIYIGPNTASKVSIRNTYITGTVGSSVSLGVFMDYPATQVKLDMDGVHLMDNGHTGLYVAAGRAVMRNSTAVGADYGVAVVGSGNVIIEDSEISNNTTGLLASGTVRLSNCGITANGTGVQISGGLVNSYGNNRIDGNTAGNGPLSGTLMLK